MPPFPRDRRWTWAGYTVVLAAAVIAVVGAKPYAGGWNDGSRFAMVECLGERGTLAIDDSVFVRPPPPSPDRPAPYPAEPKELAAFGTLDKLYIDGKFYSDKPPVLGVLMAGAYRVWLTLGGPTAAERPDLFCRWLTVLTCGLGYVVAVWCIWRLGLALGLAPRWAVALGAGVAFATVGATYTRFTNGHDPLLGVAAALCLALASAGDRPGWLRLALSGSLAGFAYTLDIGVGSPLIFCLAIYCGVVFKWRAVVVGLAALPWAAAHHALNYATGGTFAPANAVPEYLSWAGSPFDPQSMTGGFKHSPLYFLRYSLDMLFGRKGFFFHNLPLLLAPGGAVLVWLAHRANRPVVTFAAGWAWLTWILYASQSSNMSGICVSIRWFVPLIAPGFWIVGLVLRDAPRYRPDFLWFVGIGTPIAALNWWLGPWTPRMVPGFWFWIAVALIGWGVIRWRDYRPASRERQRPELPRIAPVADAPGSPTRSSSSAA